MKTKPEIIELPREKWKGTPIPLITRSDSYYDFEIEPLDHEGCTINIKRRSAEPEIVHTPEEYDFPDGLYQDHWEKAEAYGVVGDEGGCNMNAIGFYLHQGSEIIGFDTCCYTNDDIGRREVRINLGYFVHREGRRK